MNITGLPELEPLRLAMNLMAYQGGTMAATATMTGVMGASGQGIGQHIDLSLFEVHAGNIDRRTTSLVGYQYTGQAGYREDVGGIGVYPAGVLPCRDGYIQTLVFPAMWERLIQAMEMPELNDDPRFADPLKRLDETKQPAISALFQDWLNQNSRYEAMAKMQAERLPLTVVDPPSAVLDDPNFHDRDYFVHLDHPQAGRLPYTREPFRMTNSPAVAVRRAPLLGEHTDRVLQQRLGLSSAELAELRQQNVIS